MLCDRHHLVGHSILVVFLVSTIDTLRRKASPVLSSPMKMPLECMLISIQGTSGKTISVPQQTHVERKW